MKRFIALLMLGGISLSLDASQKIEKPVLTEKREFTVGGQVRDPRSFEYVEGLTLQAALELAGGVTEFGSISRVKIYREGKETTYNLKTTEGQSVRVLPSDTIDVEQKTLCGL